MLLIKLQVLIRNYALPITFESTYVGWCCWRNAIERRGKMQMTDADSYSLSFSVSFERNNFLRNEYESMKCNLIEHIFSACFLPIMCLFNA